MDATLDHIGLSVADLPAAESFYSEAFGFAREFAFALEPHPIQGLMLRHPSGARLELFLREDSKAGLHGTSAIEALRTRGYGHFALCAAQIDRIYERALAAGATERVPPSPSPEPGVRYAFLADPEGNLVELVERAA